MSFVPTFRDLLEARRRAGEPVHDEARLRDALDRERRDARAMPWFVELLSGAGGWASAAFLLSFMVCAGLDDAPFALVALGALLTGGGLGIRRAYAHVFLEQMGLALVVLGQLAIMVGTEDATKNDVVTAAVVLGVALLVLAASADAVVAFMQTCAAVFAAAYLVVDVRSTWVTHVALLGLVAVAHGALWLDVRWGGARVAALVRPTGAALFASSLVALMIATVANDFDGRRPPLAPTLALTVGLAIVALATSSRAIAETSGARRGEALAWTALGVVLIATVAHRVPGLVGAMGALVLAFRARRPVLVGLAGATAIVAGGYFYYDLSLTLLEKSGAMVGAGVIFLAARSVLRARFAVGAKEAVS